MWADGDDGRYIFWLSGWAGTGKSTIARTIAREYYDKECLMASFFFSRGSGDVSHADKFVGTIASQLAQRCAAFKKLLIKAISDDEDIKSKTLKDQWNGLVLQTLCKLDAGLFQTPLLVVVDALDECEKESDIRQVLRLLSGLQCLKKLHYRVLVTSRPDIPVRHEFSSIPDQYHQDSVLHDIPTPIVDGDIFTYLQCRLADTQRKYSLKKNWLGEEDIRVLVRKAAGLFIWADTASRFIDNGGPYLSPDRLLGILEGDSSNIGPEDALNNIYTKVLENAVGGHLKQREKRNACKILREVLGSIVTLSSPLSAHSLTQILGMPEHSVGTMLGNLHSILDIPQDPTRPIRLHHPSLRDFLLNPQRCRDPNFWVDEINTNEALANRCIQLMSQKLNKKDLCGLEDPGAKAVEVPIDKIQRCLPPELQYACEYWFSHLRLSQIRIRESDMHYFLRNCCIECLQQRRGYTSDDALACTSFLSHWLHWLHWLGAFGLAYGMIWIGQFPPTPFFQTWDYRGYRAFRLYWFSWLGAFCSVLVLVWSSRLPSNSQYLIHNAPVDSFSPRYLLAFLGPLGLGWGVEYWVNQSHWKHLNDSGRVYVFLQHHLLFWLEALSLIGKLSQGIDAIHLLEEVVDVNLLKTAQGQ